MVEPLTVKEECIFTRNGETSWGQTHSQIFADIIVGQGTPQERMVKGDLTYINVERHDGVILPCLRTQLRPPKDGEVEILKEAWDNAEAEWNKGREEMWNPTHKEVLTKV